MRYYDPEARNFGFTVRDVYELLPMADERDNKTFFIADEKGIIDVRIEKEFNGKFAAPSYMTDRYLCFKYTLRVTTHVYKNSTESWNQLWVELDD